MRLAFAALAGGAFRAPALDRWMSPAWAAQSSSHRWFEAVPDAADFDKEGAA
jgi:hypothetical protein